MERNIFYAVQEHGNLLKVASGREFLFQCFVYKMEDIYIWPYYQRTHYGSSLSPAKLLDPVYTVPNKFLSAQDLVRIGVPYEYLYK